MYKECVLKNARITLGVQIKFFGILLTIDSTMPKDKYVHSECPWRFYTFIHSLFQQIRWWSAARHPRDLKASWNLG